MRVYPSSLIRRNAQGDVDIADSVLSGSVTWDSTRKVPLTFTAQIKDDVTIAPYTDVLLPFITVVYDDGYAITRQVGEYTVVPYRQNVTMEERIYSIDARDGCWALSEDVFSNGYTAPQNANYITQVKSILTGAAITRQAIAGRTVTVAEALSWKAGTPKLDVVNDLLRAIGNYPLYFDHTGIACSTPYVSMKDATAATRYSTRTPQRVGIINTISMEPLVSEIWNKVVVVKDNSNQAPIVVTKRNTNRNSPTSIPNLGREIAKVVRDGNLADQAAATALATKLLDEGATINNRFSLSTQADPARGMYEAVELDIWQGENEIATGNWFVRGWKLGFTPKDGGMTFDLVSIADPPID